MISNSNLKNIFTIIALKLYPSILLKYWRIFYYIFWWNLKNLTPVTFKIFFKRLELRYNVSKNFFILNNNIKLKQQSRFFKTDSYIEFYLNNFLIRYNTTQFLNDKPLFLNIDELLTTDVYFETDYSFYYNFYNLKYLN